MLEEAAASRYLRKQGWLKVYRSDAGFAAVERELSVASEFGIPHQRLDRDGAQALEPTLGPPVRLTMKDGVAVVTLSAAEQQNGGIETARLNPPTAPETVIGYGTILDAAPLAGPVRQAA